MFLKNGSQVTKSLDFLINLYICFGLTKVLHKLASSPTGIMAIAEQFNALNRGQFV